MRADASSLLSKLSGEKLTYRQFPDPLADLELWPMFEALLADPRVIETKRSRVQEREFEFQRARTSDKSQAEVSVSRQQPSPGRIPHLFSAYASQAAADDVQAAEQGTQVGSAKVDLRDFLHGLKGASE